MEEETTICRHIKTSTRHRKELTQFSPTTAILTINWSLHTEFFVIVAPCILINAEFTRQKKENALLLI